MCRRTSPAFPERRSSHPEAAWSCDRRYRRPRYRRRRSARRNVQKPVWPWRDCEQRHSLLLLCLACFYGRPWLGDAFPPRRTWLPIAVPLQDDIDQDAVKSQRRTPAPRGLQDPVAIERERRDTGQPAAAGGSVRPRGPADDADEHGSCRLVLEHGTAGITGAGANSVANTVGYGVDQPDLERAGLPRRNEAGNTRRAATLAVATHRDADTGDDEAAADLDRNIRRANGYRRFSLQWNFQLQQRQVGGSAMPLHRLHVETRMDRDGADIQQLRLPVGAAVDDLVVRAGLHAVGNGEHQLWRNQGAGTEIAARADDGDDGARDAIGLRRAAANDGISGRGQQQRGCNDRCKLFHGNTLRHR